MFGSNNFSIVCAVLFKNNFITLSYYLITINGWLKRFKSF